MSLISNHSLKEWLFYGHIGWVQEWETMVQNFRLKQLQSGYVMVLEVGG